MKPLKSTSAVILWFCFSLMSMYAQTYCIPNPANGGEFGDYIDSMALSNVNNLTGYEDTNYVYYYEYKVELGIDQSYDLTIRSGEYTNDTYAAWIDYDHNGDFYGVNEKLGEFVAPSAGQVFIINFKVPDTVLLGKTRMRIRAAYNVSGMDPCTDYSYGETEDYYVNISSFGNITLPGIPQMSVNYSSEFADLNNDGYPDFIVSGHTADPEDLLTEIFFNDGSNNFSPISAGLIQLICAIISINDYNQDGWLDIFLSGTNGGDNFNFLYTNNQDGTFDELELDIPPFFAYSQDWGDYNLDGKEDLLISGEIDVPGDPFKTTSLFINNGDGSFEELDIGLPDLEGIAKFVDLDGDNRPDITVTGVDNADNRYTKIYHHRKNHIINAIPSNIKGTDYGDFEWNDFNNDRNPDIAISGEMLNGNLVYIYRNLNDTTYEIINSHEGSSFASVYWVDLNNDTILDVFIGGSYNGVVYGGNDLSFSEQKVIFPEYSEYLSVSMVDINNDHSPDFYINGYFKDEPGDFGRNFILENTSDEANTPPTVPDGLNVMINGRQIIMSWNPSTDDHTPSDRISYNVRLRNTTDNKEVILPLSDLVTGRLKMLKRGNAGFNCQYLLEKITRDKNYSLQVQAIDDNYASSAFSPAIGFYVPNFFEAINPLKDNHKYAVFCDVDTNSTLDMIRLCGNNSIIITEQDTSYIVINDPVGTYSKHYLFQLNISNGTVFLGDYNNDNYVDYQIQGYYVDNDPTPPDYYPYRNPLINKSLMNGTGDFGDFDNDGDQDLAIIGNDSLGNYYTLIYKNDSAWIPIDHNIPDISYGCVKWVDYDNDMDLDLFITGKDSSGVYFTDIYKNNRGSFSPVNIGITKFSYKYDYGNKEYYNSYTDWGDYDNDGDLDLVISGADDLNGNNLTHVYRNDRNDIFTLILETPSLKPVDWGDYNNDGYLDLLAGNKIWLNLENDIFVDIYNIEGDAWGDFNNDGKIDILGKIPSLSKSVFTLSTPPDKPVGLSYDYDSLDIILSWGEAADNESMDGGLYYNLRIGRTKDSVDIMSPCSNLKTGKLFYPHIGNVGTNRSWKLKGLTPATYYWSVQAIDQSYAGSEWASIDSFRVKDIGAEFTFDTICFGQYTSFTDQSVTTDAITNWVWDFGDGTTSDQRHPVHIFQSPDTFLVTLWAYSESGDSASRTHEVIVIPAPDAQFTVDPVCLGEISQFIDNSTLNGTVVDSWEWDFGNGFTSNYQGNVSFTYVLNDTAYLTIYAVNGCWDADTQIVVVGTYPDATMYLEEGYGSSFCDGDSTVLKVDEYDSQFRYIWLQNRVPVQFNGPKLTVKQSGNYMLMVVDTTAGCRDSSDKYFLKKFPAPSKPELLITTGSDSLCPDDIVIITVSNILEEYNYDWWRNGSIFSDKDTGYLTGYLPEGDYQARAHIFNQCAIKSDVVTITHKTAPERPSILVNNGPELFIMSCNNLNADRYQWYKNGKKIPEANRVYYIVGSEEARYFVEIEQDGFECSIKSKELLIPSLTTGIEMLNEDDNIMIIPNPNDGRFELIIIQPGINVQKVYITDISGRTVYTMKLRWTETPVNIDVSDLSEGIYILNIETKNNRLAQKFLISK